MRLKKLAAGAAIVLAVVLVGCGLTGQLSPPTPESVCAELVTAGIATNCRRTVPGGAGSRARERYDFDLVSVPGEGGSVFSFDTDADYDWTVDFYADLALVSGPHRYGNRDRRIFLQMNKNVPLEAGDRTRAIIEGL